MRCWLTLGLALLPGLAGAAPEAVPLYREIKDWVVGCDNTRACTAVAAPSVDPQDRPLILTVHREAGPDGALSLTLEASSDWDGFMRIDGEDQAFEHYRKIIGADAVLKLEGAQARELLGRLRKGEELAAETNRERRYTSLQGLSAALLLIDSVQGRVGHVGALIRPGTASAASVAGRPLVAPLPPYPVPGPVQVEQMAGIRAAAIAQAKAEREIFDNPGEDELSIQPLDTGHALVTIKTECGFYQCAYAFYKVARAAPHVVEALAFEHIAFGELTTGVGGSVDFDAQSGELNSHAIGRQYGDCGTRQTWRYDGERMRLMHLRGMERCAGLYSDVWPVLWQRQG